MLMGWEEFSNMITPLLIVAIGTVVWYTIKQFMSRLDKNEKHAVEIEEELRREINIVSDMAKETKIKLEAHDKFADKIDKKMDDMYGSIKAIEIAMAKMISNESKKHDS